MAHSVLTTKPSVVTTAQFSKASLSNKLFFNKRGNGVEPSQLSGSGDSSVVPIAVGLAVAVLLVVVGGDALAVYLFRK